MSKKFNASDYGVVLPVNMRHILSTTVGSRAHGTAGPASDIDKRSVYLLPTSQVVSLFAPPMYERTPGEDDNAWELERFVHLSLHGNPSTLEVLMTEPDAATGEGVELRTLLPHFLARRSVYGAFSGFASKERTTMHSQASKRTHKSAGHYLRVLYNGAELLRTGRMTVRIMDTPIGATVLAAKKGELSFAEVDRIGKQLQEDLRKALDQSTLPERANVELISEFVVKARSNYY